MNRKWFITIAVFTIINSITLIMLYYCLEMQSSYLFNKEDITDILGIVVSCVSIVITAYLVFLAIDAYGKIKDIDKAKVKADELIQKASSAEEIINKAQKDAQELTTLIESTSGSFEKAEYYFNKAEQYFKNIEKIKDNIGKMSQNISEQYEANKKLVSDTSHEIGEILIAFHQSAVTHAEQEKNKELKEHSLRRLFRLSINYPDLLNEGTRKKYLLNLSAFGDASDIRQLEKICNSETETEEIKRISALVLEELRKKFNK